MTKNNDVQPSLALEALTPESVRAFRIAGLYPRQSAAEAAALATHNMAKLVAELPSETLVGITIESGAISGWVNEAAPADYLKDISYALKPIGKVKASRKRTPVSTPLLEVVALREASSLGFDDDTMVRPAATQSAEVLAIPKPTLDSMWDFLSVLRTVRGGMLTMLMSPATELEQQMADDDWRRTFTGRTAELWELYRGTPVRLRVFLHAAGKTIPPRMRAEMKVMSPRASLRELSAVDCAELINPNVDVVKGHAVPEGVFLSLVRLPGASEGMPGSGLRILAPPKVAVPYSAPRKPAEALAFGRCTTVTGKSKPVWVSPLDLCRHVRIVGSSGSGKSTAMRSLVGTLIEEGYGVMVLDPPGTLCADIAGDVKDPDQIVYVDYSDPDNAPPFNLLRGETEAEFEARAQAFTNIIVDRDSEEYTGPKWRRNFGLIARACWRLLGARASLVTVMSILGSQDLTRTLTSALRSVDAALAQQLNQEMASLRGDSSNDLWSWMVCKGEEIIGSTDLSKIVGSGAHAVDLEAALNDSRAVLINLGIAELGERSAQLLGCMWLEELRQIMLNRGSWERPWVVVIDEAHLFQYGALPSLLDQARKYGISIVVSHQRPDQLRFQLKDALSANAGSYIQFRTGNPQDAASASAMLNGWPVSDLTRLRDFHAAAIISRDGVPSEPFSLMFDFFDRHRSELEDLDLRQWRQQAVRAAARRELVDPHRWLGITTRANVEELLAQAPDLRKEGAVPEPSGASRFDPLPVESDSDSTGARGLPSWLS